jgi:insertion element IS1 protein InsB
MIPKLVVYRCQKCESQKIVKNGHNASGSQQYWCKDCGTAVFWSQNAATPQNKKSKSCQPTLKRSNMHGIQRTFGVSCPTLVSWLIKDETSPKLEETLLLAKPKDVPEADEMWSFVQKRWNKRWLWTVMSRRTRQIVAFVLGNRSELLQVL